MAIALLQEGTLFKEEVEMSRLHTRETLPAFCALFILITILGISNKQTRGFWSQNQRKVISGEGVRRDDHDPVVITNIKVGSKDVDLNTEFDAEGEWLKDVSFKLKNKSSKNVTFVGADMYFPDTNNMGPMVLRPLRFGQWPGRPNPAYSPLLLKPTETIDVSIGTEYAGLKKVLESRRPVSSIKKLTVRVYAVIFEDGTKWDLGNYFTPDSSKPSGYRMIEPPPAIILKS